MAVIYAVVRWRAAPLVPLSVGTAAMMVLSLLGSLVLAKLIGPRLTKLLGHFGTPKRIESEVWRIVVFVVLAFVGMVVSWIHIHIFDRWYLRIGQLGRVTGEPGGAIEEGAVNNQKSRLDLASENRMLPTFLEGQVAVTGRRFDVSENST